MYITTLVTNTSPPTAGMMLLATIGVGDNTTALRGYDGNVTVCLSGVSRLGNVGITQEHRIEQRMLCMPNKKKETSWKATFCRMDDFES